MAKYIVSREEAQWERKPQIMCLFGPPDNHNPNRPETHNFGAFWARFA